LADYREHYLEIRSAGASVVAVSVDSPEISEALRVHLSLPFPILCDTEHRVVRDWGVYNSAEKGGIAKPAVFIIDRNHLIRYASVDGVVRRVPAAEIVSLLQNADGAEPVRRKAYVPLFSEWKNAIRNGKQRQPKRTTR
jgi:peroxiredoxin